MRALWLLSLALICLVFSGCPAYSVHPLYTDQDAVVEPNLEGTWVGDSDEKSEFHFKLSGAHQYSLEVSDPNSGRQQNYQVNLVRLGEQLFMDLVFKDQTVNGTNFDDPFGAISCHIIAKLTISGNDLAYSTLESEPIEMQNPPETRLTHVTTEGPLLVTASTEALRRYVSAHVGDGFSDWTHLTRKYEIQP